MMVDDGYPPTLARNRCPKFKVGDIVALRPAVNRNVPGGVYEVVKQLPGVNEPEYRIKSANEPHQRVARESELTKA
jgi:hypothetical protein